MMTNLSDEEAAERALASTEELDFESRLELTMGTLEKAVAANKKGDFSEENRTFFSNVAFNTAANYIIAVEEDPKLAQPNIAWRLSNTFDNLAPKNREHEAQTALNLISQIEKTLG